MCMLSRLIPELDVCDLDASLRFYVDLIGFELDYQRPEERFAMLSFEGARLMLQEATGPGRRFRTAPLERPFGRGVNFQIQCSDADKLYECVAGPERAKRVEGRDAPSPARREKRREKHT